MRTLLILAVAAIGFCCSAQTKSLVIDNQTPGWLSSKLNYGDQQTIENLTVTGYINATDLSFIGTLMQKHSLDKFLDLSEVSIIGNATDNDDELFHNIFNLSKNTNIGKLALPKTIITPKPNNKICPLIYLEVDTLIYGSEKCSEYNNSLWGYVYSGGGGAISSPKHLLLRDGTTAIAADACDNYSQNGSGGKVKIETVGCPNSIKYIGKNAFRDCKTLRIINLPDGIEEIQESAFEDTNFLPDTLVLPSSLKKYYTTAFPKKNGQTVVIPESVVEIDNTYQTYSNTYNTWYTNDYISSTNNYIFIINRVSPPSFKYYSESCLTKSMIYVPKGSLSLYKKTVPYSKATIKALPTPVTGITLSIKSATINVNESMTIVADVQPSDADNGRVTWTSSDVSVAKVEWDGFVTGTSSGKTIITATSVENPAISASCEITVHQPLRVITLYPSEMSLKVGESFEHWSIIFSPASSDNKEVTWSSSDENVAKIDANGKLIALSGGSAVISVISVEDQEVRDECNITVIQPVTDVVLNKTLLTINKDEAERLEARIIPETATNKSVNWQSSDVRVAMVSQEGTVYALQTGTATIMATSVDGGYSALCKVNVVENSGINDIKEDCNYQVQPIPGGIKVTKAKYVKVTNVYGTVIYDGDCGEILLSRGIYLVTIDGETIKIAI